MIAMIVAAALAAATPAQVVVAKELQDRTFVYLLLGLKVELELGDDHSFELRALREVRPGECGPQQDCMKDRLLIVVATRDEYPEAKGYEVAIPGEFLGIAAGGLPEDVRGKYRLIMRARAGANDEVICTHLEVGLTSASAKVVPCPAP